jgi:tetratricopeptide (TPR) repeat protein
MVQYEHEIYWPQIKSLAEAGNLNGIGELILKVSDLKERVALYRFSVRGLMFRDWANKTLNPLIFLADQAILTANEIGETDEANIICYNMSSNLANCWNDGFERTPEHYEKGLNYALRALEYRKQLKKGPGPFALAYWARGAHEFFLKRFNEAEQSFELSLKSASEAAIAANQPTDISKLTPFAILIAIGYIALTQIANGQKQGEASYQKIISTFEEMKSISQDAKEDAEIGLDQLRFVYNYTVK